MTLHHCLSNMHTMYVDAKFSGKAKRDPHPIDHKIRCAAGGFSVTRHRKKALGNKEAKALLR